MHDVASHACFYKFVVKKVNLSYLALKTFMSCTTSQQTGTPKPALFCSPPFAQSWTSGPEQVQALMESIIKDGDWTKTDPLVAVPYNATQSKILQSTELQQEVGVYAVESMVPPEDQSNPVVIEPNISGLASGHHRMVTYHPHMVSARYFFQQLACDDGIDFEDFYELADEYRCLPDHVTAAICMLWMDLDIAQSLAKSGNILRGYQFLHSKLLRTDVWSPLGPRFSPSTEIHDVPLQTRLQYRRFMGEVSNLAPIKGATPLAAAVYLMHGEWPKGGTIMQKIDPAWMSKEIELHMVTTINGCFRPEVVYDSPEDETLFPPHFVDKCRLHDNALTSAALESRKRKRVQTS